MNFYYHPILGLQWTGSFKHLFILDVESIPVLPDFAKNWKEAIELYHKTGIQFVDSSRDIFPVEPLNTITEYPI